jgi:hypothetical protein
MYFVPIPGYIIPPSRVVHKICGLIVGDKKTPTTSLTVSIHPSISWIQPNLVMLFPLSSSRSSICHLRALWHNVVRNTVHNHITEVQHSISNNNSRKTDGRKAHNQLVRNKQWKYHCSLLTVSIKERFILTVWAEWVVCLLYLGVRI